MQVVEYKGDYLWRGNRHSIDYYCINCNILVIQYNNITQTEYWEECDIYCNGCGDILIHMCDNRKCLWPKSIKEVYRILKLNIDLNIYMGYTCSNCTYCIGKLYDKAKKYDIFNDIRRGHCTKSFKITPPNNIATKLELI